MTVLKKLLNKNQESIFPQVDIAKSSIKNEQHINKTTEENIINQILSNKHFIDIVTTNVTDIILQKLLDQYNFEPTDKYLEEANKKKEYLNQLDSFLEERRQINQKVEGELGLFLQETTSNLTKALENFTVSIHNRIREAETKYGIDAIKDSVLLKSEPIKIDEEAK